jgi:NhaP-type Na+/H+ or K+/H+ antiporter
LAVVCIVAVADHTHKHSTRVAAQKAAWFCRHRGTECGGADPSAIERAWNRRERVYVVLAGALGAVAVASAVAGLRTNS